MLIQPDPSTPDTSTRLAVKVVPSSRRDQIVGPLGDRLKVKVAAPPEDGKANAAVCLLLAQALNISPRDVEGIAGHTSPEKTIRIRTLAPAQVSAALAPFFL